MISLLKYVGTGQQLDMIAARSTLVIVTIAVSFQLNLKGSIKRSVFKAYQIAAHTVCRSERTRDPL